MILLYILLLTAFYGIPIAGVFFIDWEILGPISVVPYGASCLLMSVQILGLVEFYSEYKRHCAERSAALRGEK